MSAMDIGPAQEPVNASGEEHRSLPPAQPFPFEVLPPEVAAYTSAIARAQSVHPDIPAAIALGAMASAIGMSRLYSDDYASWREPAGLWIALVSASGERKSPVLRDLLFVHHEKQAEAHKLYKIAVRGYEQEIADLEACEKERRKKGIHEPEPQRPELSHIYTSDSTFEGAVKLLHTSPRGLSVLPDELTSFFDFGRYDRTGKGDAARSFWLSCYTAEPHKSDRASREPIFLSRPLVSIVGGVQPQILARSFDSIALESGLAPRFLLVRRSPRVKRYCPGPSGPERDSYARLIRGLFALSLRDGDDPDDEPNPVELGPDEAARDVLREWIPSWSRASLAAHPYLRAAASKLEGVALRVALGLRLAREVMGRAKSGDPVGAEDIRAGIRVAEWFRGEVERIYHEIGALARTGHRSTEEVQRDELLDLIRERGGHITTRDLRDSSRKYRGQGVAQAALQSLVETGFGEWEFGAPGAKGGRSSRRFVLAVEPPKQAPRPSQQSVPTDYGPGGPVQEPPPLPPADWVTGPDREDQTEPASWPKSVAITARNGEVVDYRPQDEPCKTATRTKRSRESLAPDDPEERQRP